MKAKLKKLIDLLRGGSSPANVCDSDSLLTYLLSDGSQRRFLQLGAFNGETSDFCMAHAIKDGWTGAMIEANPPVFKDLSQALQSHRLEVKAVHCAVTGGGSAESVQFWRVTDPAKTIHPDWASRASSLSRDKLVGELTRWGHSAMDAETLVEPVTVPSLPVRSFVDESATIDLIVADLEGMDWAILRALNWRKTPCHVLKMETAHHAQPDIREATEVLTTAGYSVLQFRWDLVAWSNSFSPALKSSVR